MNRESAVLADLLDRLGRESADLRRLAGLDPDDLLRDVDKLKSVKYSFVIAIEVCIDIAQHLVSRNALRAPTSFADAFVVLHEARVLDDRLAADLADMARFRNLLVHGYARVDDRVVVKILRSRLGDIDAFVQAVAAV
jgi:uncharacterized protein YutE (UPF0331/DUF86 family)